MVNFCTYCTTLYCFSYFDLFIENFLAKKPNKLNEWFSNCLMSVVKHKESGCDIMQGKKIQCKLFQMHFVQCVLEEIAMSQVKTKLFEIQLSYNKWKIMSFTKENV